MLLEMKLRRRLHGSLEREQEARYESEKRNTVTSNSFEYAYIIRSYHCTNIHTNITDQVTLNIFLAFISLNKALYVKKYKKGFSFFQR